jgi:glycosyltransferase involved in cell wall biosynthesis
VIQRPVKKLEKRIVEESDLVVSMSEWSARSVAEDYGVPPEKIHLLPGCVVKAPDLAAPRAPRPRAVGELPRMVFVGNDWVRKGGPQLVAMHQRHFADRAELHVLSRQARPDPAARNVVWHGTVPHDVLQGEVLPSMDLMVLPTTNDMSPFAVIEAATAGLPVIATRLGGISEMVVDGESGLLVNRGDEAGLVRAVERLLSDADLRLRMGRAAREHMARHFDPDVNYNRFLDRLVALADQTCVAGG